MIQMIHVMYLVNFAQYCSKNALPVINALPHINAIPDIRRTIAIMRDTAFNTSYTAFKRSAVKTQSVNYETRLTIPKHARSI